MTIQTRMVKPLSVIRLTSAIEDKHFKSIKQQHVAMFHHNHHIANTIHNKHGQHRNERELNLV